MPRPSRLAALSPALLAGAAALAACGGPHAPAAGPALGNHTAPTGPDTSIRQVDFLNRSYDNSNIGDGPPEHITVVNGDYQRPKDGDMDEGFFHVDPPTYGDVDGDGVLDALVITIDNGGGTGMFDLVTVYTMRGGQAVAMGTIPGGDRGDGGLRAVSAEEHGPGVRVERYQSGDGDGACCPSKIAVEHWRWDGKAFVEDEARRTIEPNDEKR